MPSFAANWLTRKTSPRTKAFSSYPGPEERVQQALKEIAEILGFNTKLARFAIDCNSHARHAYKVQTGEDGISLPDPIAMCIALDPAVVTKRSEHYVDVETRSELTRGMTVVDRLNVCGDDRNREVWAQLLQTRNKVQIDWTIDNQRWKEALFAALR